MFIECPWIVSALIVYVWCTKYTQSMHEACTECAGSVHRACIDHAQNMHGGCKEHVRSVHGAYTELARRVYGVCTDCPENVQEMWAERLWCVRGACLDRSWSVLNRLYIFDGTIKLHRFALSGSHSFIRAL